MTHVEADTELALRTSMVRSTVVPERLGPYRILRCVGSGGMGVVYEALDEERGARVALKTLPDVQPGALARFKKEYRSLADLTHYNLATLYELMAIDDTWFFTMEFVDGVSFLQYVWGTKALALPPDAAGISFDAETRLRAALRQLAVGASVLHTASLLHLDLKPANALVEASGRVVILDFGLVESLERGAAGEEQAGVLVGTPLYVSPEQVLGARPTPASDWYAVGTILFEALTGTTPFEGTALNVTLARTWGPAPSPGTRRAGLPPDLVDLCVRLLEQDPERRAGARDILAVCEGAPQSIRTGTLPASGRSLIGRENELATLRAWCDEPERPLCVFVKGASGVGKTALVRELLTEIETADTMVLRGRCYERESVPYKGFDALVDALCRKIDALPFAEQRALFDADIHHTARIFSVLEDLEVLPSIPAPIGGYLEPQTLRQRAFAGLKRVLRHLGERRKLVLFVDDLHWADADSAHLLCELVADPDPPNMLVLAAYRDDEDEYSPFLREVRGRQQAGTLPFTERELHIEPLVHDDAVRFARVCLGPGEKEERAADVAREAAGIPFFIDALARHGGPAKEQGESPAPSLDRVIDARLRKMPDDARRMLQVVAIAARPIEQALAFSAAQIRGDAHAVLAQLRSAQLLRTRGLRGTDIVEVYHDRIRQNVAASLPKTALTEIHGWLATSLEAGQRTPADVLAYHLREAGELRRASEYAERAAEQAATALAFERAAELYANAWSWGDPMTDHARELQIRRAQALFNAGRCGEAATIYLAASEGAAPLERRELRRLAAEAYLYGGHIDEGLAVARTLLDEVGLSYPRSPAWAAAKTVAQLVYLRWRGIDFTRQTETGLTSQEIFPTDLGWSLGKGLGNVLPLEGTYFLVRSLASALHLGEPKRIGRGLALVGGTVLAPWRIGARYIERAEKIGRETDDPYLAGLPRIMRALGHISQTGRWKLALEMVDEGVAILRERSTGVSWEAALGTGIALKALEAIGDLGEIGRRASPWSRESTERGDLFAQTMSGQFEALALIAQGDIDGARKQDHRILLRWSRGGYTAQHLYSLYLRIYCHLYTGKPESAWDLFHLELPQIERAYFLKLPISRLPTLHLWACLKLERARTHRGERDALLEACERIRRRLAREQRMDGPAHAKLIEAGITAGRGEREKARDLLEDCRAEYRRLDMLLAAACTERRLGELSGKDDLCAAADAEMRKLGVADPTSFVHVMAPRFN
ncbi:serine/threonine-protein kinase PknK [Pendulispora albinea]|uniref:AAA family ATPase n=1 Tax=Pendulispora albinea TaxID=2741071 RepID=A0ABZ2LRE2_9BACT